MKNHRGKSVIILSAFIFFFTVQAFSANITVPYLELITRGRINNGLYELSTEGEMDILVAGGYKFGGSVVLNYESTSLEEFASSSSLSFKGASIVIKKLFAFPLDLSYFIGANDTFCSGADFTKIFGSIPITTQYSGYIYFPEGIIYDGIHAISGTGLKFVLKPSDNFLYSLYLYQDSNITQTVSGVESIWLGHYSADFRTMINFANLKIETFAGATFPISSFGYYRGGLLFYSANESVEFLTQVGIPKWDPANHNFGINLFYLLFEPRVHMGLFSIIPTFFWHPGYYLQKETNELGSFDVNINFLLGDLQKTPVSGGFESNLSFTTTGVQQFKIKASPYISLITQGVIWKIKLNAQVWPFSINNLIETFIGIKAEF